ncbi:uncharacterized protein [Diadema antillarum]|uniref:uncharacterized protein n=1 Tax=Diadema antillarum TaxID=105358 RepID=UPI003A890C23
MDIFGVVITSFRCQFCGQQYPSSADLTTHWKDSSCTTPSVSAAASSQVVTLSTEEGIIAVTEVTQLPSDAGIDISAGEKTEKQSAMTSSQKASSPSSTSRQESCPQKTPEDIAGSASSEHAPAATCTGNAENDSRESAAVPIGDLPVLVAQQVLSQIPKEANVLSLVANEISCDGQESMQMQNSLCEDSNVATVHLHPEGIVGQVAMEIHIPVHSQLIVSELACTQHETTPTNQIYLVDKKESPSEDQRPKENAKVMTVPQITWPIINRNIDREDLQAAQSKPKKISDIKKFCCEQCGRTYSKSSNLYRHMRSHRSAKHECTTCGKIFKHKKSLNAHMNNHTEQLSAKQFRCKFCDQLFPTKFKLSVHLRSHTYEKPFYCSHCGKTFMTKHGLLRHQLAHSSEKTYECNLCHKKFLRKHGLERHKSVHLGQKLYKCSICNKGFVEKYNLLNHEKVHSDSRPFPCLSCGKRFATLGTLRTHETIHTREKVHPCNKCAERFGTLTELKLHLRSHWREDHKEGDTIEANQCKECGAKFTQRSTLRAHERTHSGELPYKCDVCFKKFAYYASWRRHAKMHRGEKSFVCQKCGKGFTKKLYLLRHSNGNCHGPREQVLVPTIDNYVKAGTESFPADQGLNFGHHELSAKDVTSSQQTTADDKKSVIEVVKATELSVRDVTNTAGNGNVAVTKENSCTSVLAPELKEVKVKPFACEMCGKMYKSNSNLQRHRKSHQERKPFACNLCEKSYSRRPILTEHKLMVHGDGAPKTRYQCCECTKSYFSLGRLEIHRRKHTGERPFQCKHCEKSFKEMSNLKRHEIIHLGLKPYKCLVCGRGFNDKGNLQKHESTHGIKGAEGRANVESWKPFSCKVCGKTFKQLGYLRYHERMHQGDKLYVCNICNRKFTQAANLEVHVRAHQDKMFKCDMCSVSYRKEEKLLQHKQMCHAVKKCFVCGDCGKVLSTKANLQRHERKHQGLKPFVCPICDKGFSEKVVLKRHMKIHKEDVLTCEKCDQLFTSNEALNQHITDNGCAKSFRCRHCERTFSSKNGLARHQSSHKSMQVIPEKADDKGKKKKKMYICDICHKNFKKKKKLARHKREHASLAK